MTGVQTCALPIYTQLAPEDRILSSYIWNVEGGVQGNAKIFKFLPNRDGKFVIKYFVINDVGCISDTLTNEILIDSLPKVNFSISTLRCQNKISLLPIYPPQVVIPF